MERVMERVIEVRGIKKAFGDHEVLRGVDFAANKGEVTCIIGSSGSGKSTLLRCINLLETPDEGQILYHGEDILSGAVNLPRYHAKVGMVFQQFNLFPHLTVLENICIAPMKVKKVPRAQIERTAMELLARVGLAEKAKAYPGQLSGGQKQRVAIAGVMAMEPKCIVLDEPTAMLDPNGRKEVIRTAHELNRKKGVTIILITHYMEEVVDADKVIVMDQGKVVMQGTPREVFSQVGKLKEYRLDVPQVTILADLLRQSGIDVPVGVLHRQELVDAILRVAQIGE